MQYGFYFDQSRCTGCSTCLIACKDWHEYEQGSEPANWIQIKTTEKGRFPDLAVSHLFITCFHCARPSCVEACPAGAIAKSGADGIVSAEREVCIGSESCGGLCRSACPYQAPEYGADGKVQKCNLCLDRWTEGKKPICVAACPMRALDAGPLDELKAKYGAADQTGEGFSFSERVGPSIIFKKR